MASYGGFWRRVLAYLIDSIILGIVGGAIMGAFFGSAAGLRSIGAIDNPSQLLMGTIATVQALTFVLNWLYFALLECSTMQGTIGKKALGYALSLHDGQNVTEAHRDEATLPKSRGCPVAYRIYAVVSPFERADPRVAIISSYPFGFEGPDRRFLAVPLE